MRLRSQILPVLALLSLGAGAALPARAQGTPQFASMVTSRLLLLPAQEVAGTGDGRVWLARFDSLLTGRLEDGGIGSGWAYPRDAQHYARQNPTYISDPRTMGTQPLKSDKLKAGIGLPEPFASRLRALLAVADARNSIVPVLATIDSSKTPHEARVQIAIVDGRLSTVLWSGMVLTKYSGAPSVAADSLAAAVSRLFVSN